MTSLEKLVGSTDNGDNRNFGYVIEQSTFFLCILDRPHLSRQTDLRPRRRSHSVDFVIHQLIPAQGLCFLQ